MLVKRKESSVVTQSTMAKTLEYRIGDASKIIDMLRSKLYTHRIRTIVQEYLCNARDACREAGQKDEDMRIEVHLPSAVSPVFKVRDYGVGISPERFEEVFILYGVSTKDTDEKMTGGFGIGAKSAWAYTDSFTVTSYYNGKKYVYVSHVGSRQEGGAEMFPVEDTDEENGVEISIPVKVELNSMSYQAVPVAFHRAQGKDVEEFELAFIRATLLWKNKPKVTSLTTEDPDELLLVNSMSLKWAGVYEDENFIVLDRYANFKASTALEPGVYADVDGIPYLINNAADPFMDGFHLFVKASQKDLEVLPSREDFANKELARELVVLATRKLESLAKNLFPTPEEIRSGRNDFKEGISKSSRERRFLWKLYGLRALYAKSHFYFPAGNYLDITGDYKEGNQPVALYEATLNSAKKITGVTLSRELDCAIGVGNTEHLLVILSNASLRQARGISATGQVDEKLRGKIRFCMLDRGFKKAYYCGLNNWCGEKDEPKPGLFTEAALRELYPNVMLEDELVSLKKEKIFTEKTKIFSKDIFVHIAVTDTAPDGEFRAKILSQLQNDSKVKTVYWEDYAKTDCKHMLFFLSKIKGFSKAGVFFAKLNKSSQKAVCGNPIFTPLSALWADNSQHSNFVHALKICCSWKIEYNLKSNHFYDFLLGMFYVAEDKKIKSRLVAIDSGFQELVTQYEEYVQSLWLLKTRKDFHLAFLRKNSFKENQSVLSILSDAKYKEVYGGKIKFLDLFEKHFTLETYSRRSIFDDPALLKKIINSTYLYQKLRGRIS
jgi:hypothetical protein